MARQVTTLILGGGQGRRLFPLTGYRSKPAVPIGGKYRLVDIPISNSLNSGLKRIFVLTQFNSVSLHRHIHRTYPYEPFTQTSIELLAAEQTPSSLDWFQGTADAVRKHLPHYHIDNSDAVLILSGDHLYRMNYTAILDFHAERNADVTVATVPVGKREVSGFGIMQIRSNGHITAFREKPAPTENITPYIIPQNIREAFNLTAKKDLYLASMGVYVFKPKVLSELLSGNETDFGKEIIPKAIKQSQVYGYVFDDYWRDIGTIRAFFDANLELTKKNPPFDFMSQEGRIFTRARFLPPNSIFNSQLDNVLLSEGCMIDGAHVEESVIGVRAFIREGSVIRKSVIMGNDFYEPAKSAAKHPLGIGRNCRIENCILDKNVRIGNNVTITNHKGVQEEDGKNYFIREGLVIIPKGAVIEDGTKI
ncbi:MAG TPA: glucose-1-phosphate adenylyltransferase [Verrucomicrobiae bacterium]|jgi:glucose-1-phosphate adenylyltransferase|nr:glucose-1-phosphate adenylyltransferase [Verrucomicrobiae bacterium]